MKDLVDNLAEQFTHKFANLPELEMPYHWAYYVENHEGEGMITFIMSATPEITWMGENE
jgi:hypothetical protein